MAAAFLPAACLAAEAAAGSAAAGCSCARAAAEVGRRPVALERPADLPLRRLVRGAGAASAAGNSGVAPSDGEEGAGERLAVCEGVAAPPSRVADTWRAMAASRVLEDLRSPLRDRTDKRG